MVRPRRFELLTYSFGGCRSIQLSYGRARLSLACPLLLDTALRNLRASTRYEHAAVQIHAARVY
jgi:hypothetical protein